MRLRGRLCAALAVATGCWTWPAQAQTTAAAAPRVAIDDRPAGSALPLIESAGALPFRVAVRVALQGTDAPDALDTRLFALERRNVPIWLALPAPGSPDDVEAWRVKVRGLLERHGASLTILEIGADFEPAAVVRYAVQIAATDAGARSIAIRIALGGAAMREASRRTAIYSTDLAPYVDLLVIGPDQIADAGAWLVQADSQAKLAVVPAETRRSAETPFSQGTLEQLGSTTSIRAWRSADLTPILLQSWGAVPALLTHEMLTLDAATAALGITRNGADAAASLGHLLVLDPDTLATYFAYWSAGPGDPINVEIQASVEETPRLFDLATGEQIRLADRVYDAATRRVRVRLPVTGHAMVVNFSDEASPLSAQTAVSAERPLSVGEIIARHQRQQRAQDAVVEHYVAHARMEQHFRPTMADPGYDVVVENTYFAAPDGVEWQEQSFSVNGSKWGANRPPFPVLQPEKVLSLPLQLRFDEGYRYQLAGTERVGGRDCYVVKFDPLRNDSSLYRGTVWIDRATFARIRVRAVQSGLPAPVISNDETQDYTLAATIGEELVFLFTSLTARQLLLVAGRNLLVEKQVRFSEFRVNDAGFDLERAAARDSNAVMFRETPQGLRYYVKENGRRVVKDQPTRDLKALAMGVTLDPSYGFPLPIFGINYLNFHVRSPNTQLALLFAGVLAAGNLQRSNFGSKAIDVSVDFFAIAAPSSERLYGLRGEDPTVRLLTWPLSAGLNLGWQATPYLKATLQYQFRFDGYVRDRTTAEGFIVPTSTVAHGIGGAWEYRRGGYSLVSNATWFRRLSWRAWGAGGETSPSFVKYSAALSRDIYVNPFQKLHVNGAWFGSADVDRFGKYQFGMFEDTRLHGVPASGVRFAEVAMARAAYSFNMFEQYRLDFFAEHAWGRDEAGHGDWQRIPAFGMAINVRTVWNTILRVDVGKSLLPDRYGRLGSSTMQIMLLKPLR